MNQKTGIRNMLIWFLSLCLILISTPLSSPAAARIRLVVDGKDITSQPAPFIENSRTMVPARFVTEAIGAEVTWDEVNQTVRIVKGDRSVLMRIGSRLVEYNNGAFYQLSDVAPRIVHDRTFVPIRLVSNAFGVGIEWNANTRTVTVDSRKTSQVTPFFDVRITSHANGAVINGNTEVRVTVGEAQRLQATEMRLLLLEPQTASGFVVSRTQQIGANMAYRPCPRDQGTRVLVAALYDAEGRFIGGDAVRVLLQINPVIHFTGTDFSQLITGSITVRPAMNFLAKYVKYEITNARTGRVITVDHQDPDGSFTWTPAMEQNGANTLRMTVYDSAGNAYHGQPVDITVRVDRRLTLVGVTQGATVSRPVNLLASRNFDVQSTTYILRDVLTGREEVLSQQSWGEFRWDPQPAQSGDKEVLVRVVDSFGNTHISPPVRVRVDGSPRMSLAGVGPRQVLTGTATLSVSSNVPLENVTYILTYGNNVQRVLGTGLTGSQTLTYNPVAADAGPVSIRAEGWFQGNRVVTQTISFTVFLGRIFGPQPVIERSLFQAFAADLAQTSWRNTGMSAALQTAQAILETGWGQAVPVDKYTGQLSFNLFGIKGTGPMGSVTSNTWEVFGGVVYHVDDQFRAYSNIQESWDDHKRLLLQASRYRPFVEVMHCGTLGAWALRRAGYATDPLYAIKLIRIIHRNNLRNLDRVWL